jgi:hypothetical protein
MVMVLNLAALGDGQDFGEAMSDESHIARPSDDGGRCAARTGRRDRGLGTTLCLDPAIIANASARFRRSI